MEKVKVTKEDVLFITKGVLISAVGVLVMEFLKHQLYLLMIK